MTITVELGFEKRTSDVDTTWKIQVRQPLNLSLITLKKGDGLSKI